MKFEVAVRIEHTGHKYRATKMLDIEAPDALTAGTRAMSSTLPQGYSAYRIVQLLSVREAR